MKFLRSHSNAFNQFVFLEFSYHIWLNLCGGRCVILFFIWFWFVDFMTYYNVWEINAMTWYVFLFFHFSCNNIPCRLTLIWIIWYANAYSFRISCHTHSGHVTLIPFVWLTPPKKKYRCIYGALRAVFSLSSFRCKTI